MKTIGLLFVVGMIAISCAEGPTGLLEDATESPPGSGLPPLVTTVVATNVTGTTADVAGIVADDGGEPIVARGLVWATVPNPTRSNHSGMTTEAAGTGEFSSTLTWLVPGQTYYARAYASNSTATGYGEEIQISTLEAESEWDWRNAYGEDYMTPVRNQGKCGSCWANAVVDMVEARVKVESRDASLQPDLSVQQLVSCCMTCNGCDGGVPLYALDYIRDFGLVTGSAFPYTSGLEGEVAACPASLPGPRTFVVDPAQTDHTNSIDELKLEIVTNGPAVLYMEVYTDFYDYVSGIYTHVSGSSYGSKGCLVVGYSDAGQYWIVKNTWGSKWGESGYFRAAYSDNGIVLNPRYTVTATPSVFDGTPISAH